MFVKLYCKKLNSKTPKWFNEWYASEFVPYKIKQDFLLIIASGIFIGVVVSIFGG